MSYGSRSDMAEKGVYCPQTRVVLFETPKVEIGGGWEIVQIVQVRERDSVHGANRVARYCT